MCLSKTPVGVDVLISNCFSHHMVFVYVLFRAQWYRRKRLLVPMSLLTVMLIVAIVVGSVVGTRAGKTTNTQTNYTGIVPHSCPSELPFVDLN